MIYRFPRSRVSRPRVRTPVEGTHWGLFGLYREFILSNDNVIRVSNIIIIGGCILLHFNYDSKVTAVSTGYTSNLMNSLQNKIPTHCMYKISYLRDSIRFCFGINISGAYHFETPSLVMDLKVTIIA